MRNSPVGLIAHPGAKDDDSALMSRVAVAVAMVLVRHERRILLHASPDILTPILLCAQPARAPLVVEKEERPQSPILLVSPTMPQEMGLPEAALHAEIAIGPEGVEPPAARSASLIEQLALFGLVERREQDDDAASYLKIFDLESPKLIVALGRHPAMRPVMDAAEAYYRQTDRQCLLGRLGPRSGDVEDRDTWRDLAEFAELRTGEELSRPLVDLAREHGPEEVERRLVEWERAIAMTRWVIAVEKTLNRED